MCSLNILEVFRSFQRHTKTMTGVINTGEVVPPSTVAFRRLDPSISDLKSQHLLFVPLWYRTILSHGPVWQVYIQGARGC